MARGRLMLSPGIIIMVTDTLAIVTVVSIATITMRISMMIISRGSLGLPLAIVTVMAISTIRVSVTMMIIPGLSISLPLAIVAMMTIASISITTIAMMIISWLSIGFSNSSWLSLSLAIVAMMTITSISITTIAMMGISWLSDSCAEDGKGYSNQKIHVPVGLNSSE